MVLTTVGRQIFARRLWVWGRRVVAPVARLPPSKAEPTAFGPMPDDGASASALSVAPAGPLQLTGSVKMCPMDGNCLFHAAFAELQRLRLTSTHNIRSPQDLRRVLVEWITANGSQTEVADLTLSTWIELETEESLEAYVARMSRDGEWGGIIELYALTEMFNVSTCVWESAASSSGQPRYTRRHSLEGRRSAGQKRDPRSTDALHLHYNGSTHYTIFVPDSREYQALAAAEALQASKVTDSSATAADTPPASAAAPPAEFPSRDTPTGAGSSVATSARNGLARRRTGTGGMGSDSGRSGSDAARAYRYGSSGGVGGVGGGGSSSRSTVHEGPSRRPAKSARTLADDLLTASHRSHASSGGYRMVSTKRHAQPLSAAPAPLRDARHHSSVRRHVVGHTPAVALRPLTNTMPKLSGMSAKLGLRLERGGAMPMRTAHMPREVRV